MRQHHAFSAHSVCAEQEHTEVAEKVEVVVQRLRNAGGYAFLLGVPYSLSATPYAHSPATAPPAERLHGFEAYATALRRDLTRLRIRLASREFRLQVAILDLHALLHHIVAKPAQYSFDKATISEPCLRGTYGDSEPRRVCSDPDRHLWWDMARSFSHSYGCSLVLRFSCAVPPDSSGARGHCSRCAERDPPAFRATAGLWALAVSRLWCNRQPCQLCWLSAAELVARRRLIARVSSSPPRYRSLGLVAALSPLLSVDGGRPMLASELKPNRHDAYHAHLKVLGLGPASFGAALSGKSS